MASLQPQPTLFRQYHFPLPPTTIIPPRIGLVREVSFCYTKENGHPLAVPATRLPSAGYRTVGWASPATLQSEGGLKVIPESNVAGNVIGNVKRFSGFQDEYDRFRPAAPQMVVDILTKHLGGRPSLVIDLGCGTGLSSLIWRNHADRIVGVEPNPDMIGKARDKLRHHGADDVSFVQGYANQLDIAAGSADIVTCSQSFHWMDPSSTLQEVARVLRRGGVFAAYDCDWPPTVHWEVEQRYGGLSDRVDAVTAALPSEQDAVRKWRKEEHLANMIASKAFRFTKEIVFHDTQPCDAQRYIGLALSQGGLQAVQKVDPARLDKDIAAFSDSVEAHFRGRTLDVIFSYRMRLGVK